MLDELLSQAHAFLCWMLLVDAKQHLALYQLDAWLLVQKHLPWHRLRTQRLSSDVKLVGPVISCEGSPYQGNVTDHWRTNPHVQSYVLAMDQEALQILKKDGTVLNCYNDRWDAVYFGELGSSLAVIKAGKNIDSFISK